MIGFFLAAALVLQGAPAAQQTGVVTGQIAAKDGTRPSGVRISALAVPTGNMGPETGPNYFNNAPPASTALTDAQGRYRLDAVPAGRYFILAGTTEQPNYYAGDGAGSQTPSVVVNVTAGQTVQNIDFTLLTDIGRSVDGRINFGSAGVPAGLTAVMNGTKVEEFLETPVNPDGTFQFGRVPAGTYVLTMNPAPPGLQPLVVPVRNLDVKGLALTAPPTRTVTGRIMMLNDGPIPIGIVGFYNTQSYIGTPVNPDGTFTIALHAARHTADFAGLPVGYRVYAVTQGSNDVTKGFTVSNSDVSGLIIAVSGPTTLPRVKGKVDGLPIARTTTARIEMTGPVFGSLQAALGADGSFEIPKAVPGLYKVRILNVPEFKEMELVVTSKPLTEARLTVNTK